MQLLPLARYLVVSSLGHLLGFLVPSSLIICNRLLLQRNCFLTHEYSCQVSYTIGFLVPLRLSILKSCTSCDWNPLMLVSLAELP